MLKLMKNDLYRSTKDVSLYVGIIVFVAYAVLMAFLNKIINNMIATTTEQAMSFVPIYGRDLFKSTFSLVSDYGLLLPIFIATFAVKDLRFKTIKNKVAIGYKKWQIYLSGLFSSFIVSALILLFISLISLLLGCAFYGYGPIASVGKELAFIGLYTLISLILVFTTLSIIYLVTFITGSTGLAVTTALVLSFVFQVLIVLPALVNTSSVYDNIISFTNYSQSLSLSSKSLIADLFVKEEGIGLNLFVRSVIFTPLIMTGIIGFGIFLFNKKELK